VVWKKGEREMKDMNDLRQELDHIIQPIASSFSGGKLAVEAIMCLLDEHDMLGDYEPEPAESEFEVKAQKLARDTIEIFESHDSRCDCDDCERDREYRAGDERMEQKIADGFEK
jgi:hypothetical protein